MLLSFTDTSTYINILHKSASNRNSRVKKIYLKNPSELIVRIIYILHSRIVDWDTGPPTQIEKTRRINLNTTHKKPNKTTGVVSWYEIEKKTNGRLVIFKTKCTSLFPPTHL